MPNRTAKSITAIFAAVLAYSLATAPGHTTDAADSCLLAPKGAAPEGSHWYYRIDRPTKRHCWYVKDEKAQSQGAPQDLSPAANNVVAPKKPATPPVVANARAELPLPQPRADQDARIPAPAPSAATIAPRADAADANTQRPVAASPWPDPATVSPPVNATQATPAPVANSPVANPPSQPLAAPPPPPVRMMATRAATDSSAGKHSISIPKLLLVIAGALSVVSVMGSSIFSFGARPPVRRNVRPNWHANLDSVAVDRRPPPIYPNGARRMRDTRAVDDPSRRIAEMMAQLSRNART
jgi:hypothetical protein